MSEKPRPAADRTPIHDPWLKGDSTRSVIPQTNIWQPVAFSAGVAVPDDLAALYAYIDQEIDAMHRAGALDEGTFEVQDEFISSLIAPWYAARWEEYRRSVHTAEDLHNQTEANVAEVTNRAGSVLEEIERLQEANDTAREIVSGRRRSTKSIDGRNKGIRALLGTRGIADAPRVEAPGTRRSVAPLLHLATNPGTDHSGTAPSNTHSKENAS
jgi:hypothetical protein